MKNYEDIIHLPRHVSRKRPSMPIKDRAAQFAPFAAMVGHAAKVQESARYTETKRDLDEMEKVLIDQVLQDIQNLLVTFVPVEILYFKADEFKEGGAYIRMKSRVKKIDAYKREILFIDGFQLPIQDIMSIDILDHEEWEID